MTKPFLVLQARPETRAADDEYAALLDKCALPAERARRVRLDREALPPDLALEDVAGVIVGGGPGCVSDAEATKSAADRRIEASLARLMPRVIERDVPFMGCCYGLGILAHHLGGEVSKARYGEPVGAVDCTLTEDGRRDPLTRELPDAFRAFTGHKEAVQSLPEGCVHLVASAPCPLQMIRHGENVYATQFHPEADAEVFVVRIGVYRDAGYFPPEEADALAAACRAERVDAPERILAAFVRRYGER